MQKQRLKILMLEDDPLDADLNKIQIQTLDEYDCDLTHVDNKPDFINAINESKPDIILSDYNLPRYNGLEALIDLQSIDPSIPFVFVTGTMREEVAVDTIKAGAWDFVVKDRLFRLPLAIRSVLKLYQERVHAYQIELQNEKLSAALNQSPAHTIITDIKGNIEYVNDSFCHITGYSADEVIGENPSILKSGFHTRDFYENIWATISAGNIWRGEFFNRKKDGSMFWESASISPLKNKKGEITHFVAVKEDITLRKQMEEELISARDEAQRSNQLKISFLQNMSHEIRTPLNAIVGFSSMLNDDSMTSVDRGEYIDMINSNSFQLLTIVEDILTISRIQTGEEKINPQKVSINLLLNEMMEIFLPKAEQKNLKMSVELTLPDGKDDAVLDAGKIIQILSKLINNAIKFTTEGTIHYGYNVIDDKIHFFVTDSGIGISENELKHIFERFVQAEVGNNRQYGGNGLGLSIVKSYTEMMDGNILIESKPHKGTSVNIAIPYIPAHTSNTVIEIERKKDDNLSKTILVAEDEEFNFVLLRELLLKINVTILHAWNGKEAVKLFQEHPEIELVLMDIKMPEMDGITAMEHIKAINPNMIVIAQTAFALESDKQSLLKSGFDDFFSKPLRRNDFTARVVEILFPFAK